MSWRRDLFVRQEDGGPALSPACISLCNQALQIMQKEGKTPTLCKDSDFRGAVNECNKCLTSHPPTQNTTELVVTDPFFRLISYCDFVVHTITGSFTLTNGQVATVVYVVPEKLSVTTSTTTSSVHTSNGSSRFATSTSSNSQSVTSSPSIPASPLPDGQRSDAWIAGPVVGSIVGFAIICGALFYFWRRPGQKQQANHDATYDKAQLHSDSAPKPELDSQAIHELDAFPMRTEMPVNEASAAELSTSNEAESFEVSVTRDLNQVLSGSDTSDPTSHRTHVHT
ncbi:uncharacterized protein TRIVIDRAFT_61460 [Trichoderma virens Gv29-8]|uniref:Extracellular membrane protein CFEM domain-containing protein n=1 Tax=Hypocrea virens (strain Gv29-8 / FGSC 10586) TaxID=413071 RepID=G9MMW5_HYPVG|nr:uncharacterized protein TRIVIDRAFT_61460 [Trichoderma virens Gv29-8]EHK24683.1 hypothetical protein TRIVIDRAFT_61460 [Trichoderma virens Gv29-8]